MIKLTDPTMAGTKDPLRKIKKLEDRIEHLRQEIAMREDQIMIMSCEIGLLRMEAK